MKSGLCDIGASSLQAVFRPTQNVEKRRLIRAGLESVGHTVGSVRRSAETKLILRASDVYIDPPRSSRARTTYVSPSAISRRHPHAH